MALEIVGVKGGEQASAWSKEIVGSDAEVAAASANVRGPGYDISVRTSTPDVEDFGAYGSCAGPVHQRRGYHGQACSSMEAGGKVVVDGFLTVGACN